MAKKTKSKSKAAAAAAGARLPMTHQTVELRSNNDNAGGFPHDMFDAALCRYAHPAAVADLELLAYGGPNWKRYLEAFGNYVFDQSMMNYDPMLTGNQRELFIPDLVMMDMVMMCPLLRALSTWKGQQCLIVMQQLYYGLIYSCLPGWGRPLLPKADHLRKYMASAEECYREADDKQMKKRDSKSCTVQTSSYSVRKEVNLNTRKIDWMNLSKICIKDLVLFDSHDGKYIEGKLLVEPLTPQVGMTTVLEDSNGDVIHVAMYNFLPDGLNGRESVPLASTKFPLGGTIQIIEPFFKIFQDGQRGIRIDNPNDVSVISSGNECDKPTDEEQLLRNAKLSGNALVKKKMYNAASESYIAGIRQADMVPTLLSNRSQAYAMMNEWERSLADAAASLTMRPDNAKAWFRYNKALEILSDHNDDNRRDMITSLLRLDIDKHAAQCDTSGKDADVLKDAGNAAFRNKQYDKAAEFYTSALVLHGETSRALLANWAFCCIRSHANLDALSASFASLRIRHEAKAVNRLAKSLLCLGEPHLCQTALTTVLADAVKGSDAMNERAELLESVRFVFQALIQSESSNLRPVVSHTLASQKHLPAWIGAIEAFHAGAKKGRGVRATEDIRFGQIVLIEPPLAMSDKNDKMESLRTIDKSVVKDSSEVFLRHAIMLRSQRECLLSLIVDCLSDGVNRRGVPSLEDLMPKLSSCKLLLPTHYEFMQEEDKLELTADRVDAIVNVNSFGEMRMAGCVSTNLVPATSLFNHSAFPSCSFVAMGGCVITYAKKDIKAGDELTICYHPDSEAIQRHWGIYE